MSDRSDGSGDGGAHKKDSVENNVLTRQQAYEASFPPEPEQPKPASTYTIFADTTCMTPGKLRSCRHYLASTLRGSLWLDVDGDGKRGSESDATLNAREYDTGLGGVRVTLAECATDAAVPGTATTSLPASSAAAATGLISENPEAGGYGWPDLDALSGRYYAVYEAPRNYRLSGNVLPLGRARADDGAWACVPRGKDGVAYLAEIEARGDLDWGGYCARSIGCFDVAPKFELLRRYADVTFLPGTDEEDYIGTATHLAALPSRAMLSVGLAKEEWELPTYQYADATVTLTLPTDASAADLARGRQGLAQSLAAAFAEMLTMDGEEGDGNETGFHFEGVDIQEEAIGDGERGETPSLRRGLQGSTQVTFTLTTRGTYRPPPFAQLGTILEDSINRDPDRLTRSLRDQASLPPAFRAAESTGFTHLTLKTPSAKTTPAPLGDLGVMVMVEETRGVLASWATPFLILLPLLIVGLAVTLVIRRVLSMFELWKYIDEARGKTQSTDDDSLDLFKTNNKKAFVVAKANPDDIKSKRNVYDSDDRTASSGSSSPGDRRGRGGARGGASSSRAPRGLPAIPEDGRRGGSRGHEGERARGDESARDRDRVSGRPARSRNTGYLS